MIWITEVGVELGAKRRSAFDQYAIDLNIPISLNQLLLIRQVLVQRMIEIVIKIKHQVRILLRQLAITLFLLLKDLLVVDECIREILERRLDDTVLIILISCTILIVFWTGLFLVHAADLQHVHIVGPRAAAVVAMVLGRVIWQFQIQLFILKLLCERHVRLILRVILIRSTLLHR